MRSIARLRNTAPVAYTGRANSFNFQVGDRADPTAQLRAMGTLGTLFGIVNRTSTATSKVTWRLWRTAKSGKKEDRIEVTSHAALDVWRKPNPFFTQQEFVESEQQHVDLTGEGYWVVGRNPLSPIPLELWPVRPDRMLPVPSAENYLNGYIYRSPDGEMVPLELDEVIQIRVPNPEDPYRGMGAVQTLMPQIAGLKYSAEWNRNFFSNSAQPGGIIELSGADGVGVKLSDPEWADMVARWREQHQGVANAHRVAVLERGHWVDRKYTQEDMQFVELRQVSREEIREAFGFPKFLAGLVDDVNRANAEASTAMFAEYLTVPRADRFKGALNNDFLPLFGVTARGLEFDYDDPVPANVEAVSAKLTAAANAASVLVKSGWNADEVLDTCDLPPMTWKAPVSPPAPNPPGGNQLLVEPVPGESSAALLTITRPAVRVPVLLDAVKAPPASQDVPGDVDLAPVADDWEEHIASLVQDWTAITDAQREELATKIRQAVDAGDAAALATLTVSSTAGAALLLTAMLAMWKRASSRVVTEATAQGFTIHAIEPHEHTMSVAAGVVAKQLGDWLAAFAGREAFRRYTAGSTADDVAQGVDDALTGMSSKALTDELGGALSRAQNASRIATMGADAGLTVRYYASEVLDKNTCPPCAAIDGTELPDQMAAITAYGNGPYLLCQGGVRCRGTVVAVWSRPGDDA